jgi:5-methylcytosine-specific restriction endonuclease McrA
MPHALTGIVAEARRARDARERGMRARAQALPLICGRCAREFDRSNVHQLTVHHKDHDHGNNPADGSNWGLLCVYCHDNEHSRELEAAARETPDPRAPRATTHRPFADLAKLLKRRQRAAMEPDARVHEIPAREAGPT